MLVLFIDLGVVINLRSLGRRTGPSMEISGLVELSCSSRLSSLRQDGWIYRRRFVGHVGCRKRTRRL